VEEMNNLFLGDRPESLTQLRTSSHPQTSESQQQVCEAEKAWRIGVGSVLQTHTKQDTILKALFNDRVEVLTDSNLYYYHTFSIIIIGNY
uniref:Uncharacterized protein n=1 Tax=Vombatus ursinus TaxID=29139 RepID=A0A4X2JXX0_VOMUR